MTINEFKTNLNTWGQQKVPFLFWVDFELEKPVAVKLNEVDSRKVLFDTNGITNAKPKSVKIGKPLIKKPISLSDYKNKFSKVAYHLNYGDSFLTNLTVKTEIEIRQTMLDLFHASKAKYKLLVNDEFLVFSPEIFIQIREGKIYSFPMKGTIDASIPGASEIILNSVKEKSEHVTIVDLIRNDLSMVASNVHVARFRYLDKITTSDKDLFQLKNAINLSTEIAKHQHPKSGLFKCRIVYEKQIESIEFVPYEPREIESLKVVYDNTIEYSYKYEDRTSIDALFEQRQFCDDVLIIKNGFVTDSSFCNIIFFDGFKWVTPKTPLLNGTMRQFLLDVAEIKEQPVSVQDIPSFKSFRLINAMVGFDGPEIEVSKIVL